MKKPKINYTNEDYPYHDIDWLWRYRCENGISIKAMAGMIGSPLWKYDDAELHYLDLDDTLWPAIEVLAKVANEVVYEEDDIDLPLPVETKSTFSSILACKERQLANQKKVCGRTMKKIMALTDLLTQLFHLPSVKAGIEKGKTLEDYILSNSRYQSLNSQLAIQKARMEALEFVISKIKTDMAQPFITLS